jgi:hypothetical protein
MDLHVKLDNLCCGVCGKAGVATWSATEGARCWLHSSYTLPGESKQRPAERERRAAIEALNGKGVK